MKSFRDIGTIEMKCKTLICCLSGLLSLQALSANILWDVVSVEGYGDPVVSLVTSAGGVNFWSKFLVEVAVVNNEATLTANPGGEYILSFSGGWTKGALGDVVSHETILNRGDYFVAGVLGQETADELPISVGVGTRNYLSFVVQDAQQCFDYQDGLLAEMPDCYYGWAEYEVGKDGSLAFVRSAMNLDGDGIVVGGGAIPEPSGGLLVLLGFGLLAVRRKAP